MESWRDVTFAAYAYAFNRDRSAEGPGVVVVPTRYGGCYEGGAFAAIDVRDLTSDAFGQDTEAGDWWHDNADRVGVGATPTDALLDWHAKIGRHVRVGE